MPAEFLLSTINARILSGVAELSQAVHGAVYFP
jgi:hypothetical protein